MASGGKLIRPTELRKVSEILSPKHGNKEMDDHQTFEQLYFHVLVSDLREDEFLSLNRR